MKKQLWSLCALTAVLSLTTITSKAAGPCGVYVVPNNWTTGANNLTPTLCSNFVAAKVGWLRGGFVLPSGHTNWDSAALADYDASINMAASYGLQMSMIIDCAALYGANKNWWNSNANETTGGNGQNS